MDRDLITVSGDLEMRALVRSFFGDSEWLEHEKDLEIQKWILAMILEEC